MKISILTSIIGCVIISGNAFALNANTPVGGPYKFTGTATVLSGNPSCLGESPASISGDALVSGQTFVLHIKSSSATYATGITFKSNGYSPVPYGQPVSGSVSYVLLPSTETHKGSFTALASSGSSGSTFTEQMTLQTGALSGTTKETYQIGLAITLTSGINKALLKLLGGVL